MRRQSSRLHLIQLSNREGEPFAPRTPELHLGPRVLATAFKGSDHPLTESSMTHRLAHLQPAVMRPSRELSGSAKIGRVGGDAG